MSNLLNHNDPDKRVNVNVKSISRKQAGFVDNPTDQYPTFDVNIRVNNHTRNTVLALTKTLPEKKTASEMVSELVEKYVADMPPQTLEIYQDFVDMLEDKDKLDYKMKHK